ncbi:MAG: cysteine peptidase family C39 domain-containing protein, partial [Holophagales bacterium]|nr:cysteine peptidase family C39 domain-containing protein [Holophagales bacterium]
MSPNPPRSRRRRWVPEVVQTSAMDCGPASLLALLEGFHIRASYGRLREACQTDVDGTSIDVLEEVARQLGLEAEQVMVPADHVLLPEPSALPAIAVMRLPNGNTHFAVAWNRIGPFVQVMDPAKGRRFLRRRAFLRELYRHTMEVPAAAWREWAGSSEARRAWRSRLELLGARGSEALVDDALRDPSWRTIAALDAATRMVASLVECGALARGQGAARVLRSLLERADPGPAETGGSGGIPDHYWSVRPPEEKCDEAEMLELRGAVLVRVRGRRSEPPDAEGTVKGEAGAGPMSAELAAAVTETADASPWRTLWQLITSSDRFGPWALAGTQLLAAGLVTLEALLLRGLLDAGTLLDTPQARLAAGGVALSLALLLTVVQWPLVAGGLRWGRMLETRLRLAFLSKLPRLGDRYFSSRLHSDMAERSHAVHELRQLPALARELLQRSGRLLFTAL